MSGQLPIVPVLALCRAVASSHQLWACRAIPSRAVALAALPLFTLHPSRREISILVAFHPQLLWISL